MNLGFDLDKVFVDYPPFIPSIIIDNLYRSTRKELSYRIPSKKEQIIRIISHHPLLRPPISENIDFVRNTTNKNDNNYFLISSRFGFLRNRTNHLIKKHDFESIFKEMFFNFNNEQPHLFKERVIKKINIHKYVDDDLALLLFLAKKNKKTKFFWLNKKLTKLITENLTAITNLKSILK